MEIITITNHNIPSNRQPIVLVLGQFDGVHRGHEAILQKAKDYLKNNDDINTLAVLSFFNQVESSNGQENNVQDRITPEDMKRHLLQTHGVNHYYWINQSADKPLDYSFFQHLFSQLNIKRIVVGEDFCTSDIGTTDFIHLCDQQNIPVTAMPIIKENGHKISSQSIRELIQKGLMEPANALLGRPYTMTGTVIHGQKLGRKLGYPTINLGGTDDYVKPNPGVYIGTVGIHDENQSIQEYWHVLISAGYRPTVNGHGYLVEGYLINYDGDLYDKNVSVSFLHYMRGEIKFEGLDPLIEQMKQDEKKALQMLGQSKD